MYQVTYNKYLHIYMYTTIMYETHSEKLIVTQLVKKHPAFYGTRRIITATGPYPEPDASSQHPPTKFPIYT